MKQKRKPKHTIREAGAALKELMQNELAPIADAMIAQIMARSKKLTKATRLNALKEISWPGENAYLQKVIIAISEIAVEAIDDARKEIPKAKNVKFSETLDTLKFATTTAFDQLPPALQKKLKKQAQLMVGTQLSDLEKNVFYQYSDSESTTEDVNVLNDDLKTAAYDFIDGQSVNAGAALLAAKTVNESRNAFFFDSEVLQQVDAFIFTNGDPITQICQDLNGTVFAKDDPNMFRYTPPLHWNCKSYIEPVPAGNLDAALAKSGQDDVEPLKPSKKSLEDEIQFSEAYFQSCTLSDCSH